MAERDGALEQDRALVERCLRQDPHAWETMVQSHERRIFNLCYKLTGRRDEAEDLSQEIFMRVYQNLYSFNTDSGRLQNWILRLGRNLVIDHYRHAMRFRRAVGAEEGLDSIDLEDLKAPNPYHTTEIGEHCQVLNDALASLPAEIREAIVMRDLDGLGYEEMSAELGTPVGTIKSRVSRGRVKLAQILCKRTSHRALLRRVAAGRKSETEFWAELDWQSACANSVI